MSNPWRERFEAVPFPDGNAQDASFGAEPSLSAVAAPHLIDIRHWRISEWGAFASILAAGLMVYDHVFRRHARQ